MNFDFLARLLPSPDDKPRIHSPLVGDAEHEERECNTCKFGMPPTHRNEQDSVLPWRERGIDYECENCKKTQYVANSNSVTIAVSITIAICTIVGALLANGLLDYISNSVTNSIFAVLFSLIALAIMGLALLYAWDRVKRGAEMIEGRMRFPMVNRKPGINMVNLSMTMGILPWLIAIALGYINQRYVILEGMMIWLMVPICLLPIILGAKAGSTKMNVFLATLFWLFVGYFIVWVMS